MKTPQSNFQQTKTRTITLQNGPVHWISEKYVEILLNDQINENDDGHHLENSQQSVR